MSYSTRVILVRHGRSTFNQQGRYQGSSNEAVLIEKGIETARQVGKHLKPIAIDAVYTSPLKRVQQTVDEILKAMPLGQRPKAMTVSNELREIDLSLWEGLSYQQVKQQFPEAYQSWQQQPHEFALPSGSPDPSPGTGTVALASKLFFPVRDLYQRAQRFWQTVLPRHAGQTLLIVGHGGTNHALVSTALGLSARDHHSLQQSNCGISEIEFSHGGLPTNTVCLHQLNQTTALGETLPKLKAGKHGLRLLLLPAEGLTADACQHLADWLAPESVDFSLTVSQAQQWIDFLLQHHPAALQLSTQKVNFLQDWQQALHQSFRQSESLMTGLAIAPAQSIQNLLIQTLGGSALEANKLRLRPGHFSVIHYPHRHRPTIQAINI